MNSRYSKIIFASLAALLCTFLSSGQGVEIKHTDVFRSVVENGEAINKFIGDVKLKRENAVVTCDSAFQYLDRENSLWLTGNVKIVQADTLFLDCDHVYFDGKEDFLKANGNAKLRDPNTKISSDNLYYSRKNRLVYYNDGGIIEMEGFTLRSKEAYYYLNRSYIHFKDSVLGEGKEETIRGDSMDYYSREKKVVFLGPTEVLSNKGNLYTTGGEYLLKEKIAFLTERSSIEDSSFYIEGDTLYYEQLTRDGYGNGQIRLFSKKDDILLLGDAFRNREGGDYSKVWGKPVVRWVNGPDSLWIKADTLEKSKLDTVDILKCYKNVSIFRADMQGICDSLTYNRLDSNLIMYHDPVLWTGTNQMSSDTISAFMVGGKLDKISLVRQAFIINVDTLRNYNQIKGRNMDASFDTLGLSKVDISGNGESIYFVLSEEENSVVGMNRVWCSNMIMDFKHNKLRDIHFLVKPDAKFVPPHELAEPEKVLRGFSWRESEKPRKEYFTKPW